MLKFFISALQIVQSGAKMLSCSGEVEMHLHLASSSPLASYRDQPITEGGGGARRSLYGEKLRARAILLTTGAIALGAYIL